MTYLDNAATSFPKSTHVYERTDYAMRNLSVNAGRGSYRIAREAGDLIDTARRQAAKLFGCKEDVVVFTPSVTHAINQVLRGLPLTSESVVYITPYEHNAVARTITDLQHSIGFSLEFIPLKDNLEIDIDKTAYQFGCRHPDFVVCNVMSNVTGYVLPYAALFESAKGYGAVTVADAAQAAGIVPLDHCSSVVDYLCFTAHKSLGGNFGLAGYVAYSGDKQPLMRTFTGGTGSDSLNTGAPAQDLPYHAKYEAASPNIIAIAGLSAALDELDVEEHRAHIIHLTEYLKDALSELDNVRILGDVPDSAAVVSFVVDNYDSNDVGAILDREFDIAVRTGYHCAPYIHDYLNDKEYGGTVRVGLGAFNTKEDIDKLIAALETL